jgi:hypothetical protein
MADYTTTQTPSQTQTNQYATGNTAQAKASTDWQSNYAKQNPTGYADDRSFMVADPNGYNAYHQQRQSAYDAWSKTQQPTQTAAQPTGLIQSAMAPAPTLSPGSANQIAQNQTQGFGGAAAAPAPGQPVATPGQVMQPPPQTVPQQPLQPAAGNFGAPAAAAPGAPNTPGGIINGGLNSNADGQITGVSTYNAAQLGDPTKWDVTKEQTVAGQMQGLLSQDSGYMQLAQARALEKANASGLANSSMAVTAGQEAAYDAAMPIATQDASTYAKSAAYNADEKNQFNMANVDWQNKALMFGADAWNKATATNATNQTSVNVNKAHDETSKWVATLDSDTRKYISDQDVGVRRELGYLDADVRREGYQSNERMNALDNSTQRYGIDTTATTARRGQDITKELGYLDDSTRRYGIDTNANVTMRGQDVQKELGYLDADVRREGFDVQREMGYLDANTRTNIANMSDQTQLAVTQLGKEYDKQLQASANSAALFQNMSNQVSAIDRSDLDPQSKSNAIQRQMMTTRDALNIMGDVSNIPNLSAMYGGGYVA